MMRRALGLAVVMLGFMFAVTMACALAWDYYLYP